MNTHGSLFNKDLIGRHVEVKQFQSYQVVIWFDAKQIPEVAEGQRGIGLEAKVRIVMRWG